MLASEFLIVDFAQKDDVLKLYPEAPLLSSNELGWDGVQLQYHEHSPHKLSENYSKQHRIIIHDRSPSPPLVEEMIERRLQTKQFGSKDVTVVPANVLNSAAWDRSYKFITLSFDPSTFARHTLELVEGADVEFMLNFSKPDPLIHSIGVALKSELELAQGSRRSCLRRTLECSGVGSRLYVDSLTAALMIHLLRHYSVQKPFSQTGIKALSKQKLQQVIDYIHYHLEQNLSLAELAAIAQVSPIYFSNLFKQSTGLAPHQYVIQCRIECAKQLLLQGKLTIAEVAHSLGFAHQSHFSRHFKRLVGVTPKVFLKSQ